MAITKPKMFSYALILFVLATFGQALPALEDFICRSDSNPLAACFFESTIQATSYCSTFMGIKTVTVTSTSTPLAHKVVPTTVATSKKVQTKKIKGVSTSTSVVTVIATATSFTTTTVVVPNPNDNGREKRDILATKSYPLKCLSTFPVDPVAFTSDVLAACSCIYAPTSPVSTVSKVVRLPVQTVTSFKPVTSATTTTTIVQSITVIYTTIHAEAQVLQVMTVTSTAPLTATNTLPVDCLPTRTKTCDPDEHIAESFGDYYQLSQYLYGGRTPLDSGISTTFESGLSDCDAVKACELYINEQSGEVFNVFFVVYNLVEQKWYCSATAFDNPNEPIREPPKGGCSWGVGYYYKFTPHACSSPQVATCEPKQDIEESYGDYHLLDVYLGGYARLPGDNPYTFASTVSDCAVIERCEFFNSIPGRDGAIINTFFAVYSLTDKMWYCDSVSSDPTKLPTLPPRGDCSWGIGYLYNMLLPICPTRNSTCAPDVSVGDFDDHHYQLYQGTDYDYLDGGYIRLDDTIFTTFDSTNTDCEAVKLCADAVRAESPHLSPGLAFTGFLVNWNYRENQWYCSYTVRGDSPQHAYLPDCEWGTSYWYTRENNMINAI